MTRGEGTADFRSRYKDTVRPPGYSGTAHLALLLAGVAAGIAGSLRIAAGAWDPRHLWIIVATLVLANLVEYLAHRGPMHRRLPGLGALHTRHSDRHHRYFRHGDMFFDDAGDLHAVLFPPALLLFFGTISAVLGTLLGLALGRGAAGLFVATALGYYALYEILHLLYHAPASWRAGQFRAVRWLARLHHLHHEEGPASRHNFNLVFPLFDRVLGTLRQARACPCDRALAPGLQDREGMKP